MTPARWGRLKLLYNAALDLSQEEREPFVEQTCQTEPELAAELRALLAADVDSDHAFSSPVGEFLMYLEAPLTTLPAGSLLAGRFRLVRHIGSGGMGDVYEALDEQMEGGRFALKTIRPSIAENTVALARFKDEVRLARRVSGPNVCRIHELYLTNGHADGHCTAFLTMELLEGMTLHDRIAGGTTMPLPEIQRLFEQLCTGLSCIHGAGIVHGDLKPRNVMLVPGEGGDRLVVTDFGLARTSIAADVEGWGTTGSHSSITGTPSYMAPEQFEGREIAPSTDIYALGLVLYEMTTGVEPFAAHTPLAAAIRRSKPPVNASSLRADLPPAWDSVITRCLRYEPEQRFQSAEEVLLALRHPGKVAVRVGPRRRVLVPTSALLASALAFLILACTTLWFFVGRTRHRELAPDAAHWYALGMTALREGSYMQATRLLAMVTARDPTYALAHAALADAWTELDFTDSAQREMLLASAPDEQRGLNEMERRYIDAVRTTLIRDYSAAAQDYEAILTRLPADNKAQGYVDLGRIYEKAGKVKETVAAYERAATLNPDDPAPFLHLGILKSRLRAPAEAAKAFDRAEVLYRAESNLEGLAEVAYQRGYGANDAADSSAATHYLQNSLAIARQIPSVQLEVRSLSQLSSVAYNDSKDDQAILLANEVIDTARANGLEFWVTDGLMRLGNTYLDKGDFAKADASLREALSRSQENRHPRLEASTMLTLASLRDQQQRWDDEISLARKSLTYFRDYGFLASADQALTLIARGERSRGDYSAALDAGMKLLEDADRTHSPTSALLAEELVGGILFRLERYPEALGHHTRALELAYALKQNPGYQQLDCAAILWRLGRYEEAETRVAQIPAEVRNTVNIASGIAAIHAEMSLSREDPRAALTSVQDAWAKHPDIPASAQLNHASLLRTAALSAIQLKQLDRARQFALQLAVPAGGKVEALQGARALSVQAVFHFKSMDLVKAKDQAAESEAFFADKGMLESDALSLLLGAEIATAMGDRSTADILSKKSVDIFQQIAQSWGTPVFRQYLTRPDRQQTIQTLARLRAANGDSLHEPFR